MLQRVKESIELVCAIVYFPVQSLLRKTPLRVVICYHNMTEQESWNFRKQLAYLAKKNYKIVKVSEIFTAKTEGKKTVVAIIFDDAFVSVLENALPLLKKFSFPASIAVPTANLARRPKWNIPEGSSHTHEKKY